MNNETLKAAKQEARKLRSQGKTVKIYRESRLYTQPGRGIAVAVRYFVK